MKYIYLSFWTIIATLFLSLTSFAQKFNLGLETIDSKTKLPARWELWGTGYSLKLDSVQKHQGKYSVLIEAGKSLAADSYGCAAYTIPAIFEGKEIEVKGYLKYKGVDGAVGLMLRIDGASKVIHFENMLEKKINGTSDWKQFSLKLPYPPNAEKIHIGAIMHGNGQLSADQFQLLIDGQDFRKAKIKKRPPVAAKAPTDKEFAKGSKISLAKVTPAEIKDLSTLGRVWGFLKYYHPAVGKGDINWDYELFRVIPTYLAAKTPDLKQQILSAWIDKLGPLQAGKYKPVKEADIKYKPDLAWIESSGFNKQLVDQLNAVKNAARYKGHYYIDLFPNVRNPNFKNEDPYIAMNYQDGGLKLLSLFRYWNMVEYYFPYKALIKEDWGKVLTEFIPRFAGASNELEYKLATLALVSRVHDTHATLKDPVLNKYFGTRYAALEVRFLEDKAVVTDYFNKALGEKTGLKKGDIIEKVNGKPVSEIIKEKLPYTPASNTARQLRNIAFDILRSNDSLIVIDYIRDNKPKKVTVASYSPKSLNLAARNAKKDTCFKLLKPGISYLHSGTVKNKYLPAIVPQILKTKGLIIDLRSYPSESIVSSFSKYILPKPTQFVKFAKASLAYPGRFTYDNGKAIGDVNPDFYKGKIVILVNETTLGHAEYTAMAFSAAPNVTIVGSTTAASDGNISRILLPGGIKTGISGIGVYYADGRETQRVGIVPQIEVKPTIRGVVEGRDELLDKAIAIIDGK